MEEAVPPVVDIKAIQEETKDVDTLEFEAVSCFVVPYHCRPRQWMIRLIKWPWFERISMFVIFVNCVTLAMYDPHDKQCQSTVCQILESIEHFVFAFFLAEMLVKMVAMGVTGKKGYMQDKWNRLDCFIVIIGLIEKVLQGNNYLTINYLTIIRAFRVLRPLRAINKVPSIRILVTLLLDTLPMLGNVLLLSFLIFFVFGIVSVQLWQGRLRNRCFTNFSSPAPNFSSYNKSLFYQPSFDDPDFVCSEQLDHGTSKCSDIGSYYQDDKECHGSLQGPHTNISSLNSTACVNWNQYYTICKADGPNPFYDTTSFDNIGIAWIAIFQVITLEGWSDIMYFVQDAHSFWNWIYFVVLIVIGSFFLVNLCLVVITMQFQETKAREIELMENRRIKQQDDWAIQAKGLLNSLIHCVCSCKAPKKEHVHHHHHHFYHHHHFHHHLYSCFVPPSPNIISNGSNDQTFFHSELPTIQVEAEGSVSTPAENGDFSQTLLSPHEPVSRRSSKTSVCSHTLSIHAEASSAVSIDEIVAQTKASVTLNIPSPATAGVLTFASSSLRGGNSSNVAQSEASTSASVSAEVITQFGHESPKINDKGMHDLQTEKSSVLVAEKDKELLRKRRFSQPAHVKNSRSRPSHISSWNPPKVSGGIEELERCMDGGSLGSSDKKSENFKPDNFRKNPAAAEATTIGPVKDTSQPPEPSTGPARPTLPRRNISVQSEDEMFESFFDLKQSASYDVASGQGVWHRTRLLCRKITESQQFTFVVMGAIFLNMICMGLEHYNQSDTLTFALETTNIIFVSIFALEMIVKVMGWGLAVYLSQGQNVFDGVIVIVSVIEILLSNGNSSLSIFRSIRLLRIFKLVRPIRYQLLVVIRTMTSVMTFFGLLFLFIFAFAILGMNLFGGKFNFMNSEGKLVTARSNFDNFLWAMVTVFQILTQENWNRVMYDGMRATNKWASLYFVALMSVGYYVLFNLLVAILVEGFTGSGKGKSNRKWKRGTPETCKPRPLKTGIKKPSILITDGDSAEDCPGSYDYEPVEFCGHGVRNALGTTFNMMSNFNPCLPRLRSGSGGCRGCASGIAASGSGDPKTANNLTMPQLKKLRQASRCIVRCHDSSTWDTADQQGVSCKLSHYNPGYLKDDLDLDETADCACFNTPGQTEPCLNTSSVVMRVADDDSTNPCEKSGFELKVARSSPVHVEVDNNDDVYQLREVATPVEEAPQSERKRKSSFRSDWSLYLLSPSNRFRRRLAAICEHKFFDYAVLLFILVSCVVLALEEPHIPSDSKKRQIIDVAMFILTVVFTLEMMMKIVAQGFVIGRGTYLKDGWNVLDFILVLVSWIDVGITYSSATAPEVLGALKVFRALRTLRPLRMIRRAPGLKLVVQTLLYSLKPIGNTVLIAAIFFTMFAILGVQIFKGTFHYCHGNSHVRTKAECLDSTNGQWKNYMYNFDNLPKALISLFVFSTRDGWVEIMHHGIDAVGIDMQPIKNYAEWRLVYFIPFLMLGGFLMLNMIVGVVVENFQRCRERMEEEERQRRKKRLLEKVKNKNKQEEDRSYYESYSKLRKRVHDVCLHFYWDVAIAIVICLNVLCMSLEHYQMSQTFVIFVETANYFFTGVFVLEVIFKFIAFGCVRYFKDGWNLVDLLIVIFSLAGIIIESLSSTRKFLINPTVARTFRVLRIIRVLKLVKLAKGVRSLLDTLFEALPQVANLGLLFLLLFFIYSCLGIQLFGTLECSHAQPCHGLGTHAHFSDFGTAMLTLFRIATGDNWNGILEDTLSSECSRSSECKKYCCISKYTAPLFFVTFVLAAQFVLVNVVIAVLMKHLKESKEKIAAKMAAKDLEKKLKLLTLTAKNFIRNKARKSEVPVTRSRSIVELGLGGIELAQLKNYTPEEKLQDSFSTELSRADVIFQEFLRLNANLKKVQMRLVRTSSYKVEMPSSSSSNSPSRCRRRNTISGVRELDKTSANPGGFTAYKSGTKL